MPLKQKHNYDRALFRLIGIITMLLKDERPTIKFLAEEFNVSVRTIQKDVYERLVQFEIEKDKSGYLKFGDNFSLTTMKLNFSS